MPMHDVGLQALFSVAALLFGFLVVLPPDESLEQGRNRLRMLTSAIPVML